MSVEGERYAYEQFNNDVVPLFLTSGLNNRTGSQDQALPACNRSSILRHASWTSDAVDDECGAISFDAQQTRASAPITSSAPIGGTHELPSSGILLSLNLMPLDSGNKCTPMEANRKTIASIIGRIQAEESESDSDEPLFSRQPPHFHTGGKWVPQYGSLHVRTQPDCEIHTNNKDVNEHEHHSELTGNEEKEKDLMSKTGSDASSQEQEVDYHSSAVRSRIGSAHRRWGLMRTKLRPRTANSVRCGKRAVGRGKGSAVAVAMAATIKPTSDCLTCSTCDTTFGSHAVYMRHAIYKHGLGCDVPCPHCTKTFKQKAGRDRHMRLAHSRNMCLEHRGDVSSCAAAVSPKLVCSMCERSYTSADTFSMHLASTLHFSRITAENASQAAALFTAFHRGVLKLCPYQCTLCDFHCAGIESFVDHLKSQRHLEVTRGLVGPVQCARCHYHSYDGNDLTMHVANTPEHHTAAAHHLLGRRQPVRLCVIGEKRFDVACRYCSKIFHSVTHLKRHLKAAHPNRETSATTARSCVVKCQFCGWVARSEHNLTIHVRRKHTKERPFVCEQCESTFTDKYSLTVHLRSKKHRSVALELPYASDRPTMSSDMSENIAVDSGNQPNISQHQKNTRAHRSLVPTKYSDARRSVNNKSEAIQMLGTGALSKKVALKAGRAASAVRCRHCSYSASSNSAVREHYIALHATPTVEHKQPHNRSRGANKVASGSGKQLPAASHPEELLPKVRHACSTCGEAMTDTVDFEVHKLSHVSAMNEKDLDEMERLGPMHADFLKKNAKLSAKRACPECSTRLGGSALIMHMRLHSGHKPFVCVICHKNFMQSTALKDHLRGHFTKNDCFKCQHCSEAFQSRKDRSAHELGMHGKRTPTIACDQCDKTYSSMSACKQHVAIVHTASVEYTCSYEGCKKKFRDKAGLVVHTRRHTGEKPYVCLDCGHASASSSEQARHRRVHSGAASRRFSCDYCPYKASSRYHMTRHLRLHSGCKPYCCPYCNYRCNVGHNLRKHILQSMQHQGLPVYICPVVATPPCAFTCNTAAKLTEHAHLQHGETATRVAHVARYTGLLDVSVDVASVPEGSCALPARPRSNGGAESFELLSVPHVMEGST